MYDAIPLIIKGIIILAIWPTKRKGVTDKKFYPQIAQEVINEYAPYFEGKGVIVIGDFNCYVNQRDSSKEYGFCVNLGDRHVLAWLINLSDNQHIN